MLRKAVAEQRRKPRKRMLKGGTIAFSARHATIPCVVRDISESGARLQVQNGASVPDTFELIVELDGLEAHSVVIWRKPNEIGIEFLATPSQVAPKRAQVIESSSASLAKPQLRRNLAGSRDVTKLASEKSPIAPAAQQPAAPLPAAGRDAPATRGDGHAIPVLIAEDDPDDRLLIEDAFRESQFSHPIAFVENGEELLEYLRAEGKYVGRKTPGLILLDLNMPRMDGRTALMHLKADRALRRIPVIVLTTSRAEDDIQRTYDLGVSAYISKPGTFSELVDLVRSLNTYWSRYALLPTT